jgi:hypothetical protein
MYEQTFHCPRHYHLYWGTRVTGNKSFPSDATSGDKRMKALAFGQVECKMPEAMKMKYYIKGNFVDNIWHLTF